MSHLPVNQSRTLTSALFERVQMDALEFGENLNLNDFLENLFELRSEQALVIFDGCKDSTVVATQYGFRIYGTD